LTSFTGDVSYAGGGDAQIKSYTQQEIVVTKRRTLKRRNSYQQLRGMIASSPFAADVAVAGGCRDSTR
jgi:hypothetical protein